MLSPTPNFSEWIPVTAGTAAIAILDPSGNLLTNLPLTGFARGLRTGNGSYCGVLAVSKGRHGSSLFSTNRSREVIATNYPTRRPNKEVEQKGVHPT